MRLNVYKFVVSFVPCGETSRLFEVNCVLVRFDHSASLHRKRELRRYVNGCKTLRSRLRC